AFRGCASAARPRPGRPSSCGCERLSRRSTETASRPASGRDSAVSRLRRPEPCSSNLRRPCCTPAAPEGSGHSVRRGDGVCYAAIEAGPDGPLFAGAESAKSPLVPYCYRAPRADGLLDLGKLGGVRRIASYEDERCAFFADREYDEIRSSDESLSTASA